MAWLGDPILKAQGQIIEGTNRSLRNMACTVDVSIGKVKFNNVRLTLSFEDSNLEQMIQYEKLRKKAIEMVIK